MFLKYHITHVVSIVSTSSSTAVIALHLRQIFWSLNTLGLAWAHFTMLYRYMCIIIYYTESTVYMYIEQKGKEEEEKKGGKKEEERRGVGGGGRGMEGVIG